MTARAVAAKNTDTSEQLTLNQLLNWLAPCRQLSEATYFACIKVLGEYRQLPLRLMQSTLTAELFPSHRHYRTLNERPNRFMSASVF